VGSCFADEIGRRCTERYFDTRVNPFGVLFNPCSISDCLGLLEGYGINAEQCSFIPEDVIETSGGFCSFHHHGSMARPTAQEFLDNANRVLADASDFYYREGWVVVTLGTAFIYTDKESGNVVANCHKLPADRFERTMIDADQVYDALSQYVAARPQRQWIFTVSPVRHLSDGLHANTLSKATLHLGIEKLVNRYPNAHYFPAYEILMDELRDYRFYADDMMHPSAQAADYIFERFMDFVLADSDRPLLAEAEKVRGMMQHRILNAGTAQAAKFEAQRNQALESLLSKIR
jgi:GSCFA family.